ncbi:tetratricopeptide repeat protein 12 [Microcaecilia unicolor]|uniref:Tetratricopeptide repeat protein 12 n=1 Tax=Microcaecilia unicolor TaxID=1415580 RepID=A0A6P7ZUY9_9AMPH|nr:tetratricopeptide repeat protein 12 [Microcaecilia unicolor]XP_030076911.1 tetratricopeptide repeat protein 12 [Microcaecilia unicolor]
MAVNKEEKDFEKFLQDVDEISELIQGLSSEDPDVRQKAVSETDKRILAVDKEGIQEVEGCRTSLNRIVINSLPSDQPLHLAPEPQKMDMNKDSFLAFVEKDAKERAERRKQNTMLANALKEMGNEAFSRGDYETAVQRYSEGLDKLRDIEVLYTNRAQAYIKLEKYEDAITDCEWALRCNDKSIKARVHMGKAYLALKDYFKARQCYQKILEMDPKREKMIKDYINQVDSQERKAAQQQKAEEEFNSGKETAVSVKKLLEKLSRPHQAPLYYTGGIRLLSYTMTDCTNKTLFRTGNGFSIISDNKTIHRSINHAVGDTGAMDLCLSVLMLWQTVCQGNEENQRVLLALPNTSKQLLCLLMSQEPEIHHHTLALLAIYTQTEMGRDLISKHLDLTEVVQTLLGFMDFFDERASTAIRLLTELSPEERFRVQLRSNFSTAVLPSFTHFLEHIELINAAVLPQSATLLGSLSLDTEMRRQMAACKAFWEACLTVVNKCQSLNLGSDSRDVLFVILGLLVNLSLEQNAAVQELAVPVTRMCMALISSKDGGILTRTVGILSHVLPLCPGAVEDAVMGGIVKKMLQFLKASGQTTTLYLVKILAVCTKGSAQAREDLIKLDKRLRILMKLLDSENEQIVGNAALCLGNCLEVPGAAASLLKSDILKVLLKHAGGDAKKTAVQKNAAIALGKLCTSEPRFMAELRQFHGIEILISCMKYID